MAEPTIEELTTQVTELTTQVETTTTERDTLRTGETAFKSQISALEEDKLSLGARIESLSKGVKDANESEAIIKQLKADLGSSQKAFQGLEGQIKVDLVTRLTAYGVTEEGLKDRSLDVLKGMEEAIAATKPTGSKGQITRQQGVTGGGDNTPAVPTNGLEGALAQIAKAKKRVGVS